MIRRAEFGLLPSRVLRQFGAVSSGIRSDPTNWSDPRHQRGLAAEEQAIRYLQARGWEVIAHRFRVGRAGSAALASRGRLVALGEVKARGDLPGGSPSRQYGGAKRGTAVRGA